MAKNIYECTLEELETLSKYGGFTQEQHRAVSEILRQKYEQVIKSGQATKVVVDKYKELKSEMYGVSDMGYPYIVSQEDHSHCEKSHSDMYQDCRE